MAHSLEEKLNRKLIKYLYKKRYFKDKRIGRAFLETPRHLFVPTVPLELVYQDQVIPTKYNKQKRPISSSSQPAMMAIMLEQLGLETGMNVLEIGAGTGFNAGLMAHIVGGSGHVTTIDIDQDLVESARNHLQAAGIKNVTVVQTDGMYGYEPHAPYDRIILTVSAADIAPAWVEQLKENGRLLLPLSFNGHQKSVSFVKQDSHLLSQSIKNCGFMTLRGTMADTDWQDIVLSPPDDDSSLILNLPASLSVDPQQIFAWLTHPPAKWPLEISVTMREAWRSLSFWLALCEPNICNLEAVGDWYFQAHIPILYHFTPKKTPMGLSIGIIAEDSLAFLTNQAENDTVMALEIYAYGAPTTAEQLAAHIDAWHQADRPTSSQLQISALPSTATRPISPKTIVLPKPFTTFVITWE